MLFIAFTVHLIMLSIKSPHNCVYTNILIVIAFSSVVPSSLSMEEQKLLASLERLNSRIQEIQTNTANNPYVAQSVVPNQVSCNNNNEVYSKINW